MGLNRSKDQISQELGSDPDDARVMASQLRQGIVERKPEVVLAGKVECDEVYIVAGHKGHPWTWGSSSSCTMSVAEARLCGDP